MANPACDQTHLYQVDQEFRATKNKEIDGQTKKRILASLGIPKTDDVKTVEEDESTDSSFGDWSDHKLDVLIDPECGFPCEKDVGWFDIVQSSSPWDEARRPYDPILLYEDLELNDKEKEGHLTGQIISSGLSILDAIPMVDAYGLTKLQLPNRGLKSIQILDSYKYLQYLDISHNNVQDLSPLERATYLIVLDASHNEITEFKPNPTPWFLTFLNLSFNKLKSVPDISSMWSLKHLNLSNNAIENIERIRNLNYLEYVNFSYNQISVINNISKVPLKKLDLSWNQITHCEDEVEISSGLKNITTLQRLDLSHNQITHMDHVGCINPANLRHLNISFNFFDTVTSLDDLKRFKALRYLRLEGNQLIHELPEIVKSITHALPQLDYINGSKLTKRERLAAYSLWNSDAVISEMKRYCYDLLYSNVEPPEYGVETPSHLDYKTPIVILVGPAGTRKHELAADLASKFPEYVKVPAFHSTMFEYANHDNISAEFEKMELYHVNESEFNHMWNLGYFLFVHNDLGDLYGLSREELENDGRVCLIPLPIGPALSLTWQGLNTTMILLKPADDVEYSELLQRYVASKLKIHKERDAIREIEALEGEEDLQDEEPAEEEEEEIEDMGELDDMSGDLSQKPSRSSRKLKRKSSKQSTKSRASMMSLTTADSRSSGVKTKVWQPKNSMLSETVSIEYDMAPDLPPWCSEDSLGLDHDDDDESPPAYVPFIDTLKTHQAERDNLWDLYNGYYNEKVTYYEEIGEQLFSQTVVVEDWSSAIKKIALILADKYNASLKVAQVADEKDPLYDVLVEPRLNEMMEILADRGVVDRFDVTGVAEEGTEVMSSEPTKDTLSVPFFSRSTSSLDVTPSTSTTEVGSKEKQLGEPVHYWEPSRWPTPPSTPSSVLESMAKESVEREGFGSHAMERVIKYTKK